MEARELGRQGRQRRGGNSNAGTTSGLPKAELVAVQSEVELRGELERLVALLVPSVDWMQRVNALLRLEGLVQGGAAGFAAFPELLLGLRDALAAQMQERRSAVSRQACHAVGVLATACGASFEPLAVHLLPVVFKTLAMGIQVVSEIADACACAMLAACPSPRLLPRLCTLVAGDRNGRLRQSAAEFLLRVLEGWEPADFERQLEGVERAVLAAVQDAQAETRAVGRRMYGAYARAWPARAQAMLAHLRHDRQLQDKLAAAVQEYVPRVLPECPNPSQPVSRCSSLGSGCADILPGGLPCTTSLPCVGGAVRMAPVVPKVAPSALNSTGESTRSSPTCPATARSAAPAATGSLVQGVVWQQHAATARENQPDNRAASVQATPRSMFLKTMAQREVAAAMDVGAEAEAARQAASIRERLAPRRSMGFAALRMTATSFGRQQERNSEAEDATCQSAALAALQRTVGSQRGSMQAMLPPLPLSQAAELQQHAEPALRPLTVRRVGGLERQASAIPEDSEVSSLTSCWEEGGTGISPAASLAPLLAGLSKSGVSWADRVSVFQSVQAFMEQSGSSQVAADVASNTDRLVAALLDGSGDAHFRVAAAALAALGAGLASPCSRIFEPQLDRIMTALFARVVDPKEQIRGLVGAALSAALRQHSADAVVAGLARSLQANRAPRVKCAVMDFFAVATRGSSAIGDEQPGLLQQLTGSGLGSLLRGLLQLVTDKNQDIRRAAADAVAATCHGEAQAVMAAMNSLPPAELLAVQRAIGPAIQQQQQPGSGDPAVEMAPPLSLRPTSSAAGRAAGQRAGSLTSCRQSSGGLQRAAQQEGSRSLMLRSQQGSLAGSPTPAKQQAAVAAAAALAADPASQLTPQPPSPFMWRMPSTSPLGPTTAAAAQAGEGQQPCQQAVAPANSEPAAARVSELAPFDDVMAAQLWRLLAHLEEGPSSEALQGLSRLAHVLPVAAWPPCFERVMAAVCDALDSSSPVLRDAGLMLARDLAAAAQPSLFLPDLPKLLPKLLACAAEQEAHEVAVAADEALEALLQRAPPQSCLGVLALRLPAAGDALSTDRQRGAELHTTIHSLRRVVGHMQPAGLSAHMQPLLLPGLCAAYRSPLTDVRKATVDCLVSIQQVVGDAIMPHLESLSASQLKLLQIYFDRARTHVA